MINVATDVFEFEPFALRYRSVSESADPSIPQGERGKVKISTHLMNKTSKKKQNKKKQKKAPSFTAWGLIHLFRGWRRQSGRSINQSNWFYCWLGTSLHKFVSFVQNNLE
jgi:hypothetical protein